MKEKFYLYNGNDGFTLINLFVIIAIIAICAAMLLPALSKAMLQATEAACLSNQKQMDLVFTMYAGDNEDCGDWISGSISSPAAIAAGHYAAGYWEQLRPDPYAGGGGSSELWVSQLRAVEAMQSAPASDNNLLHPLATNPIVYHCPGDLRLNINLTVGEDPLGWACDSYSKTETVGGEGLNSPNAPSWGEVPSAKISQIRRLSDTFDFLEAADDRGYNGGTWIVKFNFPASTSFTLADPIGLDHGNVGKECFSVGHAGYHKCTGPLILAAGKPASLEEIYLPVPPVAQTANMFCNPFCSRPILGCHMGLSNAYC